MSGSVTSAVIAELARQGHTGTRRATLTLVTTGKGHYRIAECGGGVWAGVSCTLPTEKLVASIVATFMRNDLILCTAKKAADCPDIRPEDVYE